MALPSYLTLYSFTFSHRRSRAHCSAETARKKGIVVEVGSPAGLSVIAGEREVSANVGQNIRLYAMTNRFPDR